MGTKVGAVHFSLFAEAGQDLAGLHGVPPDIVSMSVGGRRHTGVKQFRLGHPRWQILLATSPQLFVVYTSNGPPAGPGAPKLGLLGADPSTLSLSLTPSAPQPTATPLPLKGSCEASGNQKRRGLDQGHSACKRQRPFQIL